MGDLILCRHAAAAQRLLNRAEEAKVTKVIAALGLNRCKDTIIGELFELVHILSSAHT